MYTPNLSFIDQWMWTLCPTDKGKCPMVVAALSLSMQHKSLMEIWADYLLPVWESGLLHDVISAVLQGIDEDSGRGLTHCFEALRSYCFALCHTLFQIIKKSRNFNRWSNLYYKICFNCNEIGSTKASTWIARTQRKWWGRVYAHFGVVRLHLLWFHYHSGVWN